MRKIHVIGAVDKSFVLVSIAKILRAMNKSTLLIDDTMRSIYRGCVPFIDPKDQYVEYDGFDVLIGCESWKDAVNIVGEKEITGYDFIIIDSDHAGHIHDWGLSDRYTLFLNFERITTTLNKEILDQFFERIESTYISKVIYPYTETKITYEFLRGEYKEYPLNWDDPSYEIDLDEVEYSAKVFNQYESRVNLKDLSKHNRKTLCEVISEWSGETLKDVRKGLKYALRNKQIKAGESQ